MDEWYLFPETLPSSRNPAAYSSLLDYVDALTATARAQGKDRWFTYSTSIAEENAFYNSGSTAGFGVQLDVNSVSRRVIVRDVYEGSPAAAAGLERGAELTMIGTNPSNMRNVSDILSAEGEAGLYDALGPSDVGVARSFRYNPNFNTVGTLETVTLTKRDYDIQPISNRYGVSIFEADGHTVGYVNLRTFIGPAEQGLKDAFAQFRARGVDHVIVDLRYNGGGLVRIAELLGDLLGGARGAGDVQNYLTHRPSKAAYDETRRFERQADAIAPRKIAFLVTGNSASASEMVVNAMTPWMRENSAIIGSNTYGKPVGQIAVDRTACDDRLRIIAFATQNADRQGDYYNGLAGKTGASCRAQDDLAKPMGDPREWMTAAALGYFSGNFCSPIEATSRAMSAKASAPSWPARPTAAQREMPGSF